MNSLRNFLFLLGEHRRKYALVVISSATVTGSEAILHPLLMKSIFDAVSRKEDFSQFIVLGLLYLLLGLVINALNYGVSLWRLKVDNTIIAEVSNKLLSGFFSKDYRTVLREGSGYYVARIRSDVTDGLAPMLAAVRNIVIYIVTFILLISVLIYLSWQAFLVLAIIIPICSFVSVLVSKRIRKLTDNERDTEAALVDILSRSVSAFKMVRSFGMQDRTLRTFSKSMDTALDSNFRKYRVVRLLQGAGDLTMVISDVCSIFVGAYFVFRNQMTLGSFIAFMNAFWRSATTLISIFNSWAELHGFSATIDRLVRFMHEHPATSYHSSSERVSAVEIDYRYDDETIFSGFSLNVEPGERCLIVGPNGTGKTTLANVLSGYLLPLNGGLQLPDRISSVTLPVHFPPLTVRDLPIDQGLLKRFGIDTPALLDAKPDTLSAGQQQKVALSLALTADADLYVLDEPLANLDTDSQALAMRAIRDRTRGRMLIMIMHNADEHLDYFDKVKVLGERIAEAA